MANSGVAWANFLKKRMEEEEQRKAAESARARSALVNQWANAQAQRQKVLEAAQAAAKAQQERLAAQRPQQRTIQPAPSHGTVNPITVPAARQAGAQALPSHGTLNPITAPAARQTATQANQGKVYDRSADSDRLNEYAQAVQNARARLTGGLPTIRQLGSTTGTAKEMTPLTAQGRVKAQEIGKKQEDRQKEALTKMQQRALELYGSTNAPVPIGLVTTQPKMHFEPEDTRDMTTSQRYNYFTQYAQDVEKEKNRYDPLKPLDYINKDDNTSNRYWLGKGLYDFGYEGMKAPMALAVANGKLSPFDEEEMRSAYRTTARSRADSLSAEGIQAGKEQEEQTAESAREQIVGILTKNQENWSWDFRNSPVMNGIADQNLSDEDFGQMAGAILGDYDRDKLKTDAGLTDKDLNELDRLWASFETSKEKSARADALNVAMDAWHAADEKTQEVTAQPDFENTIKNYDPDMYLNYYNEFGEGPEANTDAIEALQLLDEITNYSNMALGDVGENYAIKGQNRTGYARQDEDALHKAAVDEYYSFFTRQGKEPQKNPDNWRTGSIILELYALGDEEGYQRLKQYQTQAQANAEGYREGTHERRNYVTEDQTNTLKYLAMKAAAGEIGWDEVKEYARDVKAASDYLYTETMRGEWAYHADTEGLGAYLQDRVHKVYQGALALPQALAAKNMGPRAQFSGIFESNQMTRTQEPVIRENVAEYANRSKVGKWLNEHVWNKLGTDSGKALTFLYDAASSTVDQFVRDIPAVFGIPGAGQIGLIIMGGQVYGDTLLTDLENGMDSTDACAHAFYNGLKEYLTETIGLDAMTKNLPEKNVFVAAFKQMLPEGGEELLSALGDWAWEDLTNDYHSEFHQGTLNELESDPEIMQMADPVAAREAAMGKMYASRWKDAAEQAASAMLSVGMSMPAYHGAYKANRQNALMNQIGDLTPEQQLSYRGIQNRQAEIASLEAAIEAVQRGMTGTQTEEEREEEGRKAAELREREEALNAEMAQLQEELRQAEASMPTPRRSQEQMRAANEEDTTQQYPERKETRKLTDEERAAMAAEAAQEREEKRRKLTDLRAREAEISAEIRRITGADTAPGPQKGLAERRAANVEDTQRNPYEGGFRSDAMEAFAGSLRDQMPGPQQSVDQRRAMNVEDTQRLDQLNQELQQVRSEIEQEKASAPAPRRSQEQMRAGNEEDTTQRYPERTRQAEETPTAPRRTAEQVQAANEEDTTQQYPERKESRRLTDEERATMAAEAEQERGEKGRKMADLRAREAEINEELARIREERQAQEASGGRRRTAEESAAQLQGLQDRLDEAKAKLEMQMAEHDKRGKKITKLIRQATGAKVEMMKAAELLQGKNQKSAVSTGDLGEGKSIQSITKDGDIMTSDGSVIDADQVDWEKMPDTKAVYDTAMRMKKEYGIAPAAVFKAYQDGMKTEKFIDAVGSIASAGYLGTEITRVVKNNQTAAALPTKLAEEIYLQAARAGEAYRQGKIEKSRELRALKGSDNNIRFTKEAEEFLKNEPEGSKVREEVALIRDLFKGSGLNFEFFLSESNEKGEYKGEQGSINAEGTDIRIDLNAGKTNRNDAVKGAILQVGGHELTHMIATRNPEGFKALMKMVGDTLADQGKSLEKYAEDAKARYARDHGGAEMSQETAMEEAVAEASQMVLGDSQFAQKVAEKNPSLAQNIRDWLRNFARRIRDVFKNATVLNRVSLDMQSAMGEYAKVWDEALAGALGMDKGEGKRTETAKGAKGTVYTSDNTAVSYHYELVNAFELTASNDYDTLKANPYYPAELQPRDRSRQTSEDQINNIARNLNPGRLMDSSEASTGAPIVGPDYIVESGNGRTIAMQRVIKEGGEAARRYNNELKAQAERFGLNPEDVKEGSVLVRVRDSEMNRNQRADFAKAANVSSTMASAAAESAESDAKKISGKTLESYNPNGSAQGNADFYMRFLNEVVPENERNAMLTGNGQPTQALITRAENALFQRAYNNNELTQHMSERADPEAKNAVTAMMNVAARVASISDRIRGGALHDINFAGDIAAAAEQYVELKRTGQDVSDWLNQQSMFEQDDTMRAIVGLMEKHKRSATKLTAALNNMLDQVEAAGNPSQMSLLGDENLPTKGEIIERASVEEGVRYSSRGSDDETSSIKKQIKDNAGILNVMEPVYQGEVQMPAMRTRSSIIDWVMDLYESINYGVLRDGFGRIEIGKKQIKTSLNYIKSDAEMAAFVAVPEVLKNGIEINERSNHKGRGHGTVTIAAPVVINGKRGNMAVLVKLTTDNFYKTHRIIMPDGSSFEFVDKTTQTPARSRGLTENGLHAGRMASASDGIIREDAATVNPQNSEMRYSLRDFAQMSDREIVGEAMDLKDRTQVEKDFIKSYKNAYWAGRNLQDQITRNQQAMQRIGREDGKPMSQDYAAAYNRVNVLTEQLRRVEAALEEKEKNPLFRQLAEGERARSEKLVDNMDDVMAQNERLTEKLTRYEQQLVRQKQRIAEYRRAGINAAERTQLTKRITETAKSLGDMLATNTDKKHVPEALKKPLGDFLAKLNLYSRDMNEGGEGNFDDRLLSQLFARVRDVVADSQAMSSGQYDGELYMPEGFVDEMTKTVQRLEALETEYKNVDPLYKMDVESLRNLKDQLVALRWAINGINNMFANSRFKNVSDAANELYKDMMGMKEVGKAPERLKHLTKSLVTPVYFFDRLGSAGTSMFKGLREGYSLFAQRMAQIEDFADKNWGNKAANKWSTTVHEYVFEHDGVKTRINLTEAQMMTLYMYTKRAQAMNHVENGGGIKAATITKDGKNIVSQATASYLTRADIDKIAGELTAEQKDVCAKVGEYMETLSGWGNEVSMARFGYRAFNEKNYFPIFTSDTERSAMPETGARGSDLYKLLNMSFTKAINTNANNSLLIDDFFTVFANHAADMAKYSGMALPVLDTIRLLNYYDKNTKVNSREAMRHAYGTLAEDYLKTFLSDLSSATRSEERMGSNIVNSLIRNAKVASVAGNISVVLKQGISIARAGIVMPEVWLPHNMIREKQLIGYKQKYREMLEHSGIARWKSMSYYDMDTGRPLAERIAGRETWKDKFVEISGKGAELADNLTLINMWEIAKKRVRKQGLAENSQEYWDAVTDLFEDAVYRTQVVDGIMNRSELMRSKSTMDKLMTSFMAEPILTYNTFLHAVNQMRQETRSGKKISAKSMHLLLGSVYAYLLNALGESLISAFMKSARDDDDYLTYWEKFWRAWLGEGDNIWEQITSSALADGLNPLAWIPLAQKILNGINGEGSAMDTVGLEYIGKIGTEAKKWAAHIADPEKNEKPSVANSLFTTMRGLSYLAGMPLYNEVRDLKSAWNSTMGEMNPNWKIQVKEPSAAEGYSEYYQAVLDGNTEKVERLTDRLKAHDRWDSTDKKTGAVTEAGAVSSKMRDYIKADFLGGGMDYETAEKLLKEIGGAEEQGDKSAYHYLHKWSYENETGEDYSMTTELTLALQAGEDKGIRDAIQTLKDVYGVEEKNVPTKITSAVKSLYKEGEISRTQAERLLKGYTEKTDLEIDKALDKALDEAENGEDDDWKYYQSLFDLIDQGKDIRAEVQRNYPYSTKEQIKSATRSYIVQQYKDGKYNADTLEKKLNQYIEYSDAYGAYWAAQEIVYETANPDKSYHYIDSLVTAMDRGSGVQSEITRMMNHGKSKEAISTQLTSHYKPLWKAGNANTRATIQQRMCAAWQAMGYSSKEIQTKLKNLQKNWAK